MCLRHYNVIYIIVNSNVFPICRQQKHRSHMYMLSHGYSCFYSIFSANLNYSETFTRKYWSKWLPCPTNDFLFHDRVRNMRRFFWSTSLAVSKYRMENLKVNFCLQIHKRPCQCHIRLKFEKQKTECLNYW